ncbi:Piso0_005410 [Millerozyma farinosa CBS 7064]|uniref:Piso0_005410 protein n=1 Tax=Pichia sorbitophila (strain ATCC MYA-4447 / BCRC 22081 / CBS 7064 / NBRC 10061 / NRRL Y-12695) TaxID=559304 RepID=G8Y239_PICSO|nr:Piso0_005410 [Millerozyma farinosa CBS 7064]
MAIYGRNGSRRRPLSSYERDVLLSDDDDDNNKSDKILKHQSEKLSVTKDNDEGKKRKRPKPTTGTLLPNAPIKTSEEIFVEQTALKIGRLEKDSESIFRSPPRYVRALEKVVGSPTKTSPFSSPQRLSRGARLKESMVKIPSPLSSPKSSGGRSRVITDRKDSCPSTPRRTADKTTSHSPTPKEKHAWDSLLDSINTSEVRPQKIKLTPGANSSAHACENNDIENDDEAAKHMSGDKGFAIDLERILNNVTEMPTIEVHEKSGTKPDRSTRKGRTYGETRSFIAGEDPVAANSEQDKLKNEHDIEDARHNNDSEDEVIQVDDLRALGKLNADRDELEYLLEGLVVKQSDKIETSNQILILTLMEIMKLDEGFLTRNSRDIAKKLDTVIQRLANEPHSEGKNLLLYLTQQTMLFLVRREKDCSEHISGDVLPILCSHVNVRVDSTSVSKHCDENVRRLLAERQQAAATEEPATAALASCERLYSPAVLDAVAAHPTPDLDYIVRFYERHPRHSLQSLAGLLAHARSQIAARVPDRRVVCAIKVLVVASTHGAETRLDFVDPLLELIVHNYSELARGHVDPPLANAALLAMGYLINVFSEPARLASSTSSLLRRLSSAISHAPAHLDITDYLVGYSSIIVASVASVTEIDIPAHNLRHLLTQFLPKVRNSYLSARIEALLHAAPLSRA